MRFFACVRPGIKKDIHISMEAWIIIFWHLITSCALLNCCSQRILYCKLYTCRVWHHCAVWRVNPKLLVSWMIYCKYDIGTAVRPYESVTRDVLVSNWQFVIVTQFAFFLTRVCVASKDIEGNARPQKSQLWFLCIIFLFFVCWLAKSVAEVSCIFWSTTVSVFTSMLLSTLNEAPSMLSTIPSDSLQRIHLIQFSSANGYSEQLTCHDAFEDALYSYSVEQSQLHTLCNGV